MPDHDDIVNQIDNTLTSADAMRSAPDTGSPEKAPESTAFLMGMDHAHWTKLKRDDVLGHVVEMVGDPGVDRVPFGIFDIWVGDNSEAGGRHNPGNVLLIKPLLRAIVSGDLAAPDRIREHIRQLLETDQVPQVYGPALITGPLGPDAVPTGLAESVLSWIDTRSRESVARALLQVLLDGLQAGPADITIVALGD